MPAYKVVYFDARGRAEAIRLMLALAGQQFEDVRYTGEEWKKHKADAPMQQLPYLVVDGKIIPQSLAMHGFVAREFGLNGANNGETTKIEVVLATIEDLLQPLFEMFKQESEEAKKKLKESMYNERAPRFLKVLECMLKDNAGGDGFFVGSKISKADIMFFTAMEAFNNDEVLKSYPKLFALKERVAKEPKIAAYLAKRPKTQF